MNAIKRNGGESLGKQIKHNIIVLEEKNGSNVLELNRLKDNTRNNLISSYLTCI